MEFITNFFKLNERDTNISKELVAGLTTFLAMAYILPVNSFMLVKTGLPLGGVFFATAVAAAVASITRANGVFDETGAIKDDDIREQLQRFISGFAEFTRTSA